MSTADVEFSGGGGMMPDSLDVAPFLYSAGLVRATGGAVPLTWSSSPQESLRCRRGEVNVHLLGRLLFSSQLQRLSRGYRRRYNTMGRCFPCDVPSIHHLVYRRRHSHGVSQVVDSWSEVEQLSGEVSSPGGFTEIAEETFSLTRCEQSLQCHQPSVKTTLM